MTVKVKEKTLEKERRPEKWQVREEGRKSK